jgi:cell division protein FtsB
MSSTPGRKRQRPRKVPVALPADESGASAWLRSIRFSGLTIAALTLIVLAVVVLAPGLRILVEQRNEVDALRADVAAQREAVDSLSRERERWNDTNYLETLARERLDYVFPGEYTYLVIDDAETVTTADGLPISDDIQTAEVDWVQSMLSSVLSAGLGDAAAPPPSGVSSDQG